MIETSLRFVVMEMQRQFLNRYMFLVKMLRQFAQNLKTRKFWIDTTRWINFVLTIRLKKHQERTLDIRDMFRQEVLNQQSLSSKKIEKETIVIDYTD